MSKWGLAGLNNNGPHGLSEILYAFSSGTGNNGSAFAGLTANTPWYNTTLGLAMLIGRFLMIVPIMALAGSLVQKKVAPPSAGTFPVSGGTFLILLLGTVLLIGALNFLPALDARADRRALPHAAEENFFNSDSKLMTQKPPSLFDWNIVGPAIGDAFKKLNPRLMVKNPVMFVTMVGAALTTVGIFTAEPDCAASSRNWRSGSGSRCCSPILPKRWRKAAARRRPPACARRARTRWRAACGTDAKRKSPRPNCRKATRRLRSGRRHSRRRRSHRRNRQRG